MQDKDLSQVDLKELKRREEVVEWQITIARGQTLRDKEERLKQLQKEINKRQSS
jgi:chaperonin cofactor prefoldin